MPLAAVALLALARCRRRLYVRYREAFGLAFAALSCWATITGGVQGGGARGGGAGSGMAENALVAGARRAAWA